MFEIRRYAADNAAEWNAFVERSKQGTFLFNRGYMDYHRDRFSDNSLMVYHRQRLFALLPGNRCGDTFYSHQGLTYGGFVTDEKATAGRLCEIAGAVSEALRADGVRRIVYKPVPWVYHRLPAEDDLYALSIRCHARLIGRDASSVVFLRQRLRFAESRMSGVRKALRQGFEVKGSDDLEAFWNILTDNLHRKYGAKPVHTVAEMRMLKDRFPKEIRLFMIYRDAVPLGGTVLYLTPQVVRTQYISATPEGKQTGALDLLFHHLLNETDFQRPYFDFGTSAQGDTDELNASLIFQKEGFGGRTVCFDRYEWEV